MFTLVFCYFYCMIEMINNKTYNTDTSTPVKYCVDVEELGDGYIRYSTKVVYFKNKDNSYFLYVKRVTTSNKRGDIFDIQEYIVPVKDNWVKQFGRGMPEVYQEGSGLKGCNHRS